MRDILSEILKYKKDWVEERKSLVPEKSLTRSIFFDSKPVSLKKYIERPDKEGIIAEIKRKSPSKGIINGYISVEKLSIGYMQAGACALSVLTDVQFFGGSDKDLQIARKYNFCPILRKDFIIDEYQILEAKSIGADAILLIAAALPHDRLKALIEFAHSLQLEVLMEIHNQDEWHKVENLAFDIIGVNNRDLKTFEVSLDNSVNLSKLIPREAIKISESGIKTPEDILFLREHGFKGFLIGENFMKEARPYEAASEFICKLKRAGMKA